MASGCRAPRMLGDDDFGPARVQLGDDRVRIEGLVAQEAAKLDTFDKGADPHGVEALTGHQDKADQVAQGIGEGEYLGRQPASRLAYGLARSRRPGRGGEP